MGNCYSGDNTINTINKTNGGQVSSARPDRKMSKSSKGMKLLYKYNCMKFSFYKKDNYIFYFKCEKNLIFVF